MGYFTQHFKSDEEGEDSGDGTFLKGKHFDGKGLELKFVSMEAVEANNPAYGANEADFLYKESLLQKGKTFRYTFMTDKGEKIYDTKSGGFFIGMKNADPSLGDKLHISRTGTGISTRYNVEIL